MRLPFLLLFLLLTSFIPVESQQIPVQIQLPKINPNQTERPVISLELLDKRIEVERERNITIMVKNIGSKKAKEVIMDLYPGLFLSLSETRFVVRDVAPNSSKEVVTKAKISKYASSPVEIWARLTYWDENGTIYTDYVQLSIEPVIPGLPDIRIVPSGSSLSPDSIQKVKFYVMNLGGRAHNITIYLQIPGNMGAIIGQGMLKVDELEKGERKELSVDVFVSPNVYGAFVMNAVISWQDYRNFTFYGTQSFGYKVMGEPKIGVITYTTYPDRVLPGDKGVKLVLVITNVGNYMAKDLWINLSLPDGVKPSFGGSDKFRIPALLPNSQVQVSYQLDFDEKLNPGNYRIDVVTSGAGNTSIYITVFGKADPYIVNVSSIPKASPGSRGVKLSVLMKNNGSADADDTKVEIISPYLTGTTSVAVGNIPQNGSKSVIMEVDISSYAPSGDIPLEFHITWSQDSRTISKVITAHLSLEEKSNSNYLYAIPLILMAALLIIFLRKRVKL